ncbi:MAG: hypothetical protein Tp172DCM1112201_6 [Prokaryotic dsDNA virus sp.]|nr:MAG: hypothetical protein Tp172DCM1112201_6 [Prokaryotic dsDNA virus sp.]|tara:strand:- start:18865 stop:19950 length:1086 start_codon:yes stop_codon:yes gene_type:complete
MAKKKKAKAPEVEDNLDVVYDGIPGADKVTDEDVKPFDVDLNFEEEPKAEDAEEVTEEEEVEEAEESEPEQAEEESPEGEEPEGEEPVEETEGEGTESDSPEGVSEESTDDTRQPEGGDEEATSETKDTSDKEPMIPKSRFDEVLSKQKALQRQVDELKNPAPEKMEKAPEFDFDTKEVEYQDLILNGKTDDAAKLRAEIRAAEKDQMLFEMQNMAGKTVEQSAETMQLQAKAVELATKFPELDETHKDFDQVKTQEVLDLRDAFMTQGHAPADALQKAADYIVPPSIVEDVKPDTKVEKKVQEKKKVANTNKKIEASESQPPAMKGKNKVDKKIDVDLLSADEFDALPEETVRRMRGDFG